MGWGGEVALQRSQRTVTLIDKLDGLPLPA